MMAMKAPTMDDQAPAMGSRIGRVALIAAGSLGAVFGIGVITGLLSAHFGRGESVEFRLVALVAGAALFAIGSAWIAYRATRALTRAAGAPTARERRNRIVLIACGALGGIIAMLLTLAGPSPLSALSNDPLPPAIAVPLALIVAVLMPVLCLYWHRRAVDEQEEAAYKLGALFGIYTYFIGAPTWWLLWRGGLAPAPDGIVIYFTIITVTGAIWLWAKYR